MESLRRLQDLHADLTALTETRFANVDRLLRELETSVQEFRALLDKPAQNNKSRASLESGKITIDGDDYATNNEFREISLQVALALDLDELEAAKLTHQVQSDTANPKASVIPLVVSLFHDRRDLLLQNMRLILQESLNLEDDDRLEETFRDIVSQILETKTGSASSGSVFVKKCLLAMNDIEKWQVRVSEQIQSRQLLGQARGDETYATLEFQRASLFKQHEALAAILTYLFRSGHTISEDLRKLLEVPKRWDRLEMQLVHYLPIFSAAFAQYGSPDHSSTLRDARALNTSIGRIDQQANQSLLQPFYATLTLLWISEYSGWYREPGNFSPLQGADLDKEEQERATSVKRALNDGALEVLLSACSSMTIETWRHPARQELVTLLLSESSGHNLEADQTSDFFRSLFMECLDSFTEVWITNMPDSIRQLKSEEDDQRLLEITAMQDGLSVAPDQNLLTPLHLESFLVLIAFAFEQRPAVAEDFWSDPDGNLYGFVQWASKRQTVPRVSAFCEMLCSISEGPDHASAAHKFLLDESAPASARGRRSPSMNYQQIFAELELYSRKVHERPGTSQVQQMRKVLPTDMNELESPVMLSCYLRLISHLCRQSTTTRQYIFEGAGIDLPQILLTLASGSVPSYLRASIFSTLEALATDKTSQISKSMWNTLDLWASGGYAGFSTALAKHPQGAQSTMQSLHSTLNAMSMSYDQYDAFVVLLHRLTLPAVDDPKGGPSLPFPEDLGASYRLPGIAPYVDYVCGQLFSKRIHDLSDETQIRVFRLHCLDFIASCLETFNENYVTTVERGANGREVSQASSAALHYMQRHPFASTMDWLFTDDVIKALMASARQPFEDVMSATPDSPLVTGLQRSIDVFNLVMELQPTYLDIVRPSIRTIDRPSSVPTSAITSIEECIADNPQLICELCLYAATRHDSLVLKSLNLLQKLSSSRRLNSMPTTVSGFYTRPKRIIDMVGPESASDMSIVSSALAEQLQFDIRELESGPDFPGYVIKDGVLAFLNVCLDSQPGEINIAHLILGFTRIGETLVISPDSQLDFGIAVLNSVISLVEEYPDGEGLSFLSRLVHIKTSAFHVLRHLWSSPVSVSLVMVQLRQYQMLQSQFLQLAVVSPTTLWDSLLITDPAFWYGHAGDALLEYLSYRTCVFEYAALELQSATQLKLTVIQKQIHSTLLGKSMDPGGNQIANANIFELSDFMDINVNEGPQPPELRHFARLDFERLSCQESESPPLLYDLNAVRGMMHNFLASDPNRSQNPNDEDQIRKEEEAVLGYYQAINTQTLAAHERRKTVHAWTELTIAALECFPMDAGAKVHFILQALQTIIPKLDSFILDVADTGEALDLARAGDAILLHVSLVAQSTPLSGRMESLVTDRLFQLFRICIDGIHKPNSSSVIREVLCSICSQYLIRVSTSSDSNIKARHSSMDCVRSAGASLINVLSEDSEDGLDSARLAGLTVLGHLTSLARSEKSPFVLDCFVQANILEILIDPLKGIRNDLQAMEQRSRAHFLDIMQARLLLLLQISRTKDGAVSLLEAGLLLAVRESELFRMDPDLGFDIPSVSSSGNGPQDLYSYYSLISTILRVLVSTFFSKGVHNEQCRFIMRQFLQDYRPNMVGLMKKASGVNGKVKDQRTGEVLGEIMSNYVRLVEMCEFVEFEVDEDGNGGFKNRSGFS